MNVVYIGIGIMFLLWGTGVLYRGRKNGKKVVCIVESRCTGCRRCVGRCSRRVFETVKNGTEIYVEVKYPDKCTACGDCLAKCKFNALKLIDRI
jgi:NAD-dependent dihydropyrimidine dehydrogenase PreA subunit